MTPEQSQITSSSPADFQSLCWLITTAQSTLLSHFPIVSPSQLDILRPGLEQFSLILKLHYVYSSFQQSVKQLDKSWIPKGRIEQVIRACCDGRYRDHDIERLFYVQGGINGVLVLHLGTRFQNAMFAQIYSLPLELVEELARKCGTEEISPFVRAWIEGFDKSRGEFLFITQLISIESTKIIYLGEFDPSEPSPRLDRFAKDKEIRLSSQPSLRRKSSQSYGKSYTSIGFHFLKTHFKLQ
ncbi:hypothetical protein BGZ60DRAFT_158322 [Tricladium varicosporioides]|nr:hypothetical protein BGZ60DRAFT_158322 [Hymenoscyphus varicosporioides]